MSQRGSAVTRPVHYTSSLDSRWTPRRPAGALACSRHRAGSRRVCVLEPLRAADAARDELEIAPFDLERERPPCQIEFDQAPFQLPSELLQNPFHAIPIDEVAFEGDFLPDRLALSPGFGWAVILAV